MTDVCELCGFRVSRGDLQDHVKTVTDRARLGQGGWLLTLNTEMLARATRDPAYRSLISQADIITADGMPLVWASKFKYPASHVAERTTGVDLVAAILRLEEVPPFAVIGGKNPQETIKRYGAEAVHACRFIFDGKVDLSEDQLVLFFEELSKNKVQVVFIALGVPKQDQLALQLRARMPSLVVTGIGGTFEILGPEGARAPRWMQRSGLEWFFRLVKEPRRLWRRYLINYPRGIGLLLRDCFGKSVQASSSHDGTR